MMTCNISMKMRERLSLACILETHLELFQGQTGTLNVSPVLFELRDGAAPHAAKPFPIPKPHESLTRVEWKRFKDAGTWKQSFAPKWAAPWLAAVQSASVVLTVWCHVIHFINLRFQHWEQCPSPIHRKGGSDCFTRWVMILSSARLWSRVDRDCRCHGRMATFENRTFCSFLEIQFK